MFFNPKFDRLRERLTPIIILAYRAGRVQFAHNLIAQWNNWQARQDR